MKALRKTDTALSLNRLYSARECQMLDRIAIEQFGIPSYDLMTSAASAALGFVQKQWPHVQNVVLACGGGNNGGDGLVLARLLKQLGIGVDVFLLAQPDNLKGDARRAYDDALAAGLDIKAMDVDLFQESLHLSGLLVDALLGTGTQGELRDDVKAVVQVANAHAKQVLAIDAPTGLCADTGKVLGQALKASATITFIAHKSGLVTGQARDYVGRLYCDSLQLPSGVFEALDVSMPVQQSIKHSVSFTKLRPLLPRSMATSHKGHHGHVLLVGGDKGFGGAIALAGSAALRVGAGLVSVACHPDNAATVTTLRPELMCSGIEKPDDLNALINRASLIALGPGLGQSAWSQAIFSKIIEEKALRVVDADGLNWLAQNPETKNNWVLTPHPGEAARLLNSTGEQVNDDRYAAAQALQEKFGGVIVLKGAGSLIQSEKCCSVCLDGNPGMASGGMGDVLTGVLAGLLARNEAQARNTQLDLQVISSLAVCLHSAAADMAAQEGGCQGLLASDVIDQLRVLIN